MGQSWNKNRTKADRKKESNNNNKKEQEQQQLKQEQKSRDFPETEQEFQAQFF